MPQARKFRLFPPDAGRANADPRYIRWLIAQIDLSAWQIALRIGISDRTVEAYGRGERRCPYPAQYCLECLLDEQLATNKAGLPKRVSPRWRDPHGRARRVTPLARLNDSAQA